MRGREKKRERERERERERGRGREGGREREWERERKHIKQRRLRMPLGQERLADGMIDKLKCIQRHRQAGKCTQSYKRMYYVARRVVSRSPS